MYEPFDVSAIVTKLRLDLEQLFQASNHLIYIGRVWPTAEWLALQAENRLHYCINDLSGIITELSKLPPVVQIWGFGEVSLSEHGPFRGKPVNEDFDLCQYLSLGRADGNGEYRAYETVPRRCVATCGEPKKNPA